MYKQILSLQNFQEAYFDIVQRLDETGKSHRYTGIDGVCLNDIDFVSSDIIEQAREELASKADITPVIETRIPKKDGTKRRVYIFTLKDRIKSQAIYRVINPIIDKNLSPYLFSYRKNFPTYMAARSVAKRYKKYYGRDTIMISDISEYSQNIDKDILREKMLNIGIPDEVIELFNLFIYPPILSGEGITKLKKGITDGNVLTVICYNLYLNEMDKYVGKRVSLYRRVGDDFILCDQSKEKINEAKDYILSEIKKLKLKIKKEKTQLVFSDQPFKYVGYIFHNGKVSINPDTIQKFINHWQRKLRYYPIPIEKKLRRLTQIIFKGESPIYNDFVQLLSLYRQVTDENQVKEVSQNFYRILTKYFFDKYSSRNQRLTINLTKELKIPSLFQDYLAFHHGKTTISSLSLSRKKLNKTRNTAINIG